MMTNQAQPSWTWSRTSAAKTRSGGLIGRDRRGGGGGLHRLRLGVGLGGDVDELVDLVVGEAGELAELAGELDRVLVVLAAEAAEAEQLVDGALELERPLAPLGVVRR